MFSVDTGLSGAICWWDFTGPVGIIDMPTIQVKGGRILNLPEMVKSFYVDCGPIVFEMNYQNWKLVNCCGVIQGIGATLGNELVPIHPAKWKKALGLTGKSKDDSRELAIKLYPQFEDQLKRKKDHDRAEALLIGHWYLQKGKSE